MNLKTKLSLIAFGAVVCVLGLTLFAKVILFGFAVLCFLAAYLDKKLRMRMIGLGIITIVLVFKTSVGVVLLAVVVLRQLAKDNSILFAGSANPKDQTVNRN